MPDSGKVHFVMQFNPVPASTRVMHFSEGDDDGWVICNIRNEKDDLPTDIPSEWRNVRYEMDEELPESKFSDDSTRIHIKILNYTPEAGQKILANWTLLDFDVCDFEKQYSISHNGTATVSLHPCFPVTLYMCLGKGDYSPSLIVPGTSLYILMDLGKDGTNPVIHFKGELATTNYELNVKGAGNFSSFRRDEAYFDSLLNENVNIKSELRWRLNDYYKSIEMSPYCKSTKEWMMMNAEYQHSNSINSGYNLYVPRKLNSELTNANSPFVKNKYLWEGISDGLRIHYDTENPYKTCYSKNFTYSPDFMNLFRYVYVLNEEDRLSPDFMDVWRFTKAINAEFLISDELGLKESEKIKSPVLKDYYPVAVKRWKEYVDRMNKTPHIHFNEHGDMEGEELKRAVLKDYQGKNVVFLVYDRTECGKELGEVESLLKKINRKNVVFIHVDKLDCLLMGARPWYEAAKGRTGEHYGGSRVRYYTMFPNYQDETKVMYSFYDSSGNNTLETQDKEVAFDAIRKLQRK